MWHLTIKKLGPTPRRKTDQFDRADRESARPIDKACVLSVRTTSGVQRQFTKPDGRYHLGNPHIIAKNRARQVERFTELTRQLEAAGPHSGIRQTVRGEDNATIDTVEHTATKAV